MTKLPPNQNQKGDHIVTFKINIPQQLSPEMEALFREIAKTEVNKNNTQSSAGESASASASGSSSSSSSKSTKQEENTEKTGEKTEDDGTIFDKFKNIWGNKN